MIYAAKIEFIAEDEVYGSETYFIKAATEQEAAEYAFKLSEGSIYFDDRIDFRREEDVSEYDDHDFPPDERLHLAPTPAIKR